MESSASDSFFTGRKNLLKGVRNFPQRRICHLDRQQKESFKRIDQKSFSTFLFFKGKRDIRCFVKLESTLKFCPTQDFYILKELALLKLNDVYNNFLVL